MVVTGGTYPNRVAGALERRGLCRAADGRNFGKGKANRWKRRGVCRLGGAWGNGAVPTRAAVLKGDFAVVR